MKTLNYELKLLCLRNRDGSHSTRAIRERQLALAANQLHELGFRGLRARSLKPKHVERLVEHWVRKGLSAGTLKNRLAALRWWAEKVGKPGVVARSNDHYGIDRRDYAAHTNRALKLTVQQLNAVKDPHVRASLRLQQAFGLRREEAIKFRPSFADRGNHIALKASWTKGGKARDVPVRTESQREALAEAHRVAGRDALIPSHRTYYEQLKIYERHTQAAGLSKLHGLRHAYAQVRYEELTGWPSPVAGGPTARQLNPEQREVDHRARLTISRELGHEREQITRLYCG